MTAGTADPCDGNPDGHPERRSLCHPITTRVAWVGIALALWVSPTRPGTSVCWSKHVTGIPCPGCGMTRSMSCALRGLFQESVNFHPFGPFVLVAFVAIAAASLLPESARRWLDGAAQGSAGLLRAAKYGFLAAFLGYGFVRAALQIIGWADFGP